MALCLPVQVFLIFGLSGVVLQSEFRVQVAFQPLALKA